MGPRRSKWPRSAPAASTAAFQTRRRLLVDSAARAPGPAGRWPDLAGSLLSGLIDQVVAYIAPVLIGVAASRRWRGLVPEHRRRQRFHFFMAGSDTTVTGAPASPSRPGIALTPHRPRSLPVPNSLARTPDGSRSRPRRRTRPGRSGTTPRTGTARPIRRPRPSTAPGGSSSPRSAASTRGTARR